MSNSHALATLLSLAEDASEEAAKVLAQVRQTHTQMAEQLHMLENYQSEYRQKLNQTLHTGMDSDKWQNYQQFLVTLELTIEQQQQQLTLWEQRVSDANRHWQEKQQRVNAFDTLIQRAEHTQSQRQNRLEQKQMDEFAQRATLRRTQ
ncbi:flagella biosynthesis chaperone FliJ [Providencia sp. PROV188]|uniref:Flagellar FliJ protein n=1 Tax=Providencia alcalifaciens TaxID=126385 RepID=A0A4R3NYZ7_9GAMM|nr:MULTISPECIES: flagellar export protein FliJ [Providencia]ETT00886.1 flagellar export protein FliJ [Providencia alcalifaciens PAL-3]EUD00074.1 flagellar export protein FliJ [Providencia alcalifaciens PAL-1]MBC5789996.1 flagella biosynthesis chaperone FliJ [Providencia sp. JUb39]MBG5881672.1 flagella biosynthesis chaperone FliJ [Providencia alcalifaciens]MBS0925467.1 flagella biosynthesis chaperone FliJ [Providencia sp. JGM181]